MITLDLVKIGKWGSAASATILVSMAIAIMFCLPDNEEGLLWLILLGIPLVISKFALYGFLILWFLGMVKERRERKET